MANSIALLPCPFCEGPPVPLVQNDWPERGAAPLMDDYSDDGLHVSAMVFCHECGAESSRVEETIYTRDDYYEIEARAVAIWQRRDNRHRPFFDGGEADGLNLYPRLDVPR